MVETATDRFEARRDERAQRDFDEAPDTVQFNVATFQTRHAAPDSTEWQTGEVHAPKCCARDDEN